MIGSFPSVNNNEGYLNDLDRENLKKIDIELAKTTLEALYNDNFNIYKAFTTSEEKLYLSYISSNSEGGTEKPSTLLLKIKKIFPKIEETSDIIAKPEIITNKKATFDELLLNIRNFKDGKEISKIWFEIYKIFEKDKEWEQKLKTSVKALEFTNNPQSLNKENVQKLYGNTLKTSVSRLEKYKSCPFSFYLKYGLKIKEQEEFKIRTIDTGSFMHEVIDTFFKFLQEKNINIDMLSEEKLKEIIYDIIQEKLSMSKNYIFTSTPKYVILTERLSKVVYESITYLVKQLKDSKFEVYETEIEFKDSSKYKPIVINLSDNKKVELTGKIDRVDVAKIGDEKYVRIIDYKSSIKDLDLNQVVAGLQIQLISYLSTITENENLQPAGVLYFNLIDSIIKNSKNISDEEVKEKIRKMYKMKGLIVADIDIVRAMDLKLEKGFSDTIPVYLDKEGNVSKSRSSVITKEDFENLQRYSKKLIKEISLEIMNGGIDKRPFYMNKKTGCDYCEYKSICGFDVNNGDKFNYISSFDKNYVLDIIKEEVKSDDK